MHRALEGQVHSGYSIGTTNAWPKEIKLLKKDSGLEGTENFTEFLEYIITTLYHSYHIKSCERPHGKTNNLHRRKQRRS